MSSQLILSTTSTLSNELTNLLGNQRMNIFEKIGIDILKAGFKLWSHTKLPKLDGKIQLKGIKGDIEIIRDEWGIPHIYAENEADLFFAQGFNAARDRLFQFEIWRRQSTGTVSEILGERELKRDIGTRLFQFRGDIKAEMNHYHDHGELIITAYVAGVNKYIELTEKNPKLLPLEFGLLGIKPKNGRQK